MGHGGVELTFARELADARATRLGVRDAFRNWLMRAA
jgi:hypothetical protein